MSSRATYCADESLLERSLARTRSYWRATENGLYRASAYTEKNDGILI